MIDSREQIGQHVVLVYGTLAERAATPARNLPGNSAIGRGFLAATKPFRWLLRSTGALQIPSGHRTEVQ